MHRYRRYWKRIGDGHAAAMNADEARGTERLEVSLDVRPQTGYRYMTTAMKGVLYYNFGMIERGLAMAGTFLFVDIDEDARSKVQCSSTSRSSSGAPPSTTGSS